MEQTNVDVYLAIRAKLPKKTEVALWTEKKIVAFLLFFEQFVQEGRVKPTVEKRKIMEEECEKHEFWGEFMARIDVPTNGPTTAVPVFTQRLITFSRIVLSYLKTEPHAITDEMLPIMERNPRCHWALNLYRMKKGLMGVETVAASDIEETNKGQANIAKESTTKRPEVMFNEALTITTSILRSLVKGIKKDDLNKMTTEDRLKYSVSLLKAVGTVVKKYTPNKQVFNQININSAKRGDLEKAFLNYAELNMQENEE